jgi:hypothetical protein
VPALYQQEPVASVTSPMRKSTSRSWAVAREVEGRSGRGTNLILLLMMREIILNDATDQFFWLRASWLEEEAAAAAAAKEERKEHCLSMQTAGPLTQRAE